MCVTVIRFNIISLHLQGIGRRGPTKSKSLSHSAFHLSTLIALFLSAKDKSFIPVENALVY